MFLKKDSRLDVLFLIILFDNDYRVARLSGLYLIFTGRFKLAFN